MIQAMVMSDDQKVKDYFDATRWFEQADAQDIVQLSESGWGGDFPADEVANYFQEKETKRVFDYLEIVAEEEVGYECYVDTIDALQWLKTHRSHILEKLLDSKYTVLPNGYQVVIKD